MENLLLLMRRGNCQIVMPRLSALAFLGKFLFIFQAVSIPYMLRCGMFVVASHFDKSGADASVRHALSDKRLLVWVACWSICDSLCCYLVQV